MAVNITNKDNIPEFGMQTFENKKAPSDFVPENDSLLDQTTGIMSSLPLLLFGLGSIIFMFSLLTGRPNWTLLGGMAAGLFVMQMF